jgi:hypothetical protein
MKSRSPGSVQSDWNLPSDATAASWPNVIAVAVPVNLSARPDLNMN